jgi:hypothetical protein
MKAMIDAALECSTKPDEQIGSEVMDREKVIKLLAEFFLDTFIEDADDVQNWWAQGDLDMDQLDAFHDAVSAIMNEQ